MACVAEASRSGGRELDRVEERLGGARVDVWVAEGHELEQMTVGHDVAHEVELAIDAVGEVDGLSLPRWFR